MNKIGKGLLYLLQNLFALIGSFFVGRNKKNILIGCWGGNKYCDNSRFLFQYLSSNKELFNLKNVIFVTRNPKVLDEISSLGFSGCLIGTRESKYWHLKCGVHIVCNMNREIMSFKPDIDTRYSFGAVKIQLWHGVGIKACGKMSNKYASEHKTFLNKITIFMGSFISQGGWSNSFFVATSEENKRVAVEDLGYKKKKVIIASYPRLQKIDKLLSDEKRIIDRITNIQKTHKVIIYLPTFKSISAKYLSPCQIKGFTHFLEKNNYFWVQKKHSADLMDKAFNDDSSQNILTLDSDFDINVLYDYVDLVITDYSSVSSDAIFKGLLSIEYCPDFNEYKNEDRGFVNDFEKYHVNKPVTDSSELFSAIDNCFSNRETYDSKCMSVKSFLFGEKKWTMEEIFKEIKRFTKI